MPNVIIAFLVSVGAGGWVYSKLARRSGGGNTQPAIIGSAVIVIILFIILYFTLNTYLKK